MGYTKFITTWNTFVPFIRILDPASNLCHTCKKNTDHIRGLTNVSEEEKLRVLQAHQEQKSKAKQERKLYNSAVDESKNFPLQPQALIQANPPCSVEGTMHYSFDYAQQVHFPCNPQQPGPIYFKTPRKCGIFGVCCEAIPRQINFLIDESVQTGKGGNTTISYLHNFFENHGLGETNVHLHADNCGGQNKNNYVLWYLCWRVLHGLHRNIDYAFLIAGHTKFSPDWCFGLMNKKLRRTFTSSLFDIMQAVDSSTTTNVNYGKLVGLHDGTVLVKTYQWDEHLSTYFRKLKGISRYHHFRFSEDSPGKVFYRKYADSPEIGARCFSRLRRAG